jgi:hypothetical protein
MTPGEITQFIANAQQRNPRMVFTADADVWTVTRDHSDGNAEITTLPAPEANEEYAAFHQRFWDSVLPSRLSPPRLPSQQERRSR